MQYKNQSLTKYLDDLAARLPAPGGGSAAALNAALAASLISMVVNFSLGKPRYARFQKELRAIFIKSERLRKQFLVLVDLDVLAYQSNRILRQLAVPLRLAGLCCQAAQLCPSLIKKGNINLISDVAVAAVLLDSAFVSAYFNVEINLKNLGQPKTTQKTRREMKRMYKIVCKIRKNTEAAVGKIIRG